MNKMILTNQLKEISSITRVDYNLLLLRFFMEEFLIRISLSQYRNDFVFKGGFLLSSLLGISNRTTMDMDISISNLSFEESKLKNIIEIIINNYGDPSITYEIQEIKPIIEDNKYGGLCVKLIGRLENIRQSFTVDFATGDPITPSAIHYDYHLMINNKVISIKSYNLETVIAEKLQTVVEKGLANSRSKDFYDLYIIFKTHRYELDIENLNKSVYNTFDYRKTKWDYDEVINLLSLITASKIMETRWIRFSNSHPFANNLIYTDIIDEISELVKTLRVEAKLVKANI